MGYNEVGIENQAVFDDLKNRIKREIGTAKQNSDLVIVSFHWGIEYTTQPKPRQKELAHLAIDSGADLIVGNHPHWIQPVEVYKDKLIVYSHGNFVFDQMWSQKTREGMVGKYYFYNNKLIDAEFFPVIIEDYGQPRFAMDTQKEKILKRFKEESLKLNN